MNHLNTRVVGYILNLFALLLISTASWADDTAYVAGKHYQLLTDVKENEAMEGFREAAKSNVQVIEFFSYGCSWCFKLDPVVDKWAKTAPDYVTFQRVPVEFQPSWRTLTKAYYAAAALDKLEDLHHSLFEAIHTDALTNSSEDVLKTFFVEQGVSPEDFDATFDSFAVNRKQKWASALSQAFRITAIPSILVQGPSGAYLSSVRMAGSEEGLMKVVDYLVEKERAAMTSSEVKQK